MQQYNVIIFILIYITKTENPHPSENFHTATKVESVSELQLKSPFSQPTDGAVLLWVPCCDFSLWWGCAARPGVHKLSTAPIPHGTVSSGHTRRPQYGLFPCNSQAGDPTLKGSQRGKRVKRRQNCPGKLSGATACSQGLGRSRGGANPRQPLHQAAVWAVQTHLLIPRYKSVENNQ